MKARPVIFAALLAAGCGPNPEFQAFHTANNINRVAVPYDNAIDLGALTCAAAKFAVENEFSHFATAKLTMQVENGYAVSPAILSDLSDATGKTKVVLATYGFYRSAEDWRAVKTEKIGDLSAAETFSQSCGDQA